MSKTVDVLSHLYLLVDSMVALVLIDDVPMIIISWPPIAIVAG